MSRLGLCCNFYGVTGGEFKGLFVKRHEEVTVNSSWNERQLYISGVFSYAVANTKWCCALIVKAISQENVFTYCLILIQILRIQLFYNEYEMIQRGKVLEMIDMILEL